MAGEVTLPTIDVTGAPEPATPQGTPALAFGGRVAMVNPDGTVGMVDKADATTALAQGLRPATRAEFDSEDMGAAGQVASGAIGASRGLTFGLSDTAIVGASRALGGEKAAEEYREALNRAKEANPGASLGGEIAGSLAGAFLMPGGGSSAAVKGEGLLARGASRFLAAAPRAALEGAAMGVGNQLSEDTLGNHELNAEKYVASAFKGAVYGGLLGGSLHAAGGAVADKARTFYGAATRGGEALAEGGVYRTAGKLAEDGAEKEASPFMSWLREKVVGGAEEQAFKATGAKIRDVQKLGASAEAQVDRSRRIGRRLLDEGIVTGTASQEQIARRLTAKVKSVGEELGALRASLDKALERPDASKIASRFEAEVMRPLSEVPLGEIEGKPAAAFVESMLEKGGERPDFATLFKYRKRLDTLLERGGEYSRVPGGPAKPGAEQLRALRGIVEEEFEQAGERAAKELGGSFLTEYKLGKEAYSDLITAEKIITKEVARGNANRAISLTDTISGGAGLIAGGAVGQIAGALGNKMLRTYGNQAAADILNRASRLEFLARASAQVDAKITNGVKGFLSGTKAEATATVGPKVTQATVAAIREATRDPAALTAKVGEMLGGRGLNEAAPKTSQAMANTVMRIAAHLQNVAPKEPAPTGVSFVPQRSRPGSASEQARFADAVEAANDPVAVIDDLRRGRVSRVKVEALKACYPQLYQQVRSEIASQAAELRPNLTQQQQIGLSVLFDVPVSAIMQPQNIRAFNQSFAQGANPEQSGEAGGQQPVQPGRGLARKGSLASGFDKQEAP